MVVVTPTDHPKSYIYKFLFVCPFGRSLLLLQLTVLSRIYKFLYVCPFDYINRFYHTSRVVVVTPADRPKSYIYIFMCPFDYKAVAVSGKAERS